MKDKKQCGKEGAVMRKGRNDRSVRLRDEMVEDVSFVGTTRDT